jgi:hypothetical protein
MSGTTLTRALPLLTTLALTACTTQPAAPTTQSLLDNMSAAPRASLASCAALNMALVCRSAGASRARVSGNDGPCSCADRNQLILGGR